MRTSLRWCLSASVLASAAAWFWPQGRDGGVRHLSVDAPTSSPMPTPWPTPLAAARAVTSGAVAESAPRMDAATARGGPGEGAPATAATTVSAADVTADADSLVAQPAFDPFVGEVAPPPAPPPAPKPLVGPVFEAPAPPPPAPAMPYRYLGRMVDPAGKPLVYLAKADKDVQVGVGSRLDEGYVVDTISAEALELSYPPLGMRVSIPIPPTQP